MTDTAQPSDPNAPKTTSGQPTGGTVTVPVGNIAKEVEAAPFGNTLEISRDLTGVEIDLPKEVAAVGVKTQPTVVPLPQLVQQLGVKAAGSNIPVPQVITPVVLPLTDDQIAKGLTQGVESSLRWAAEWCVRRLKQMHIVLKLIGGKVVRTKHK